MHNIKYLPGTYNRVLLVAPHKGETGTGKIARRISKRLECPAIINVRIKRDDSDLNRREGAFQHPEYMSALRSWVKIERGGRPLVIWLHGHSQKPRCIYGYGQPDELIADKGTVQALVSKLQEYGLDCVDAANGFEQFAARHKSNMAQFFKGEGFDVNSIQLELSRQVRGMFLEDFVAALCESIKTVVEPTLSVSTVSVDVAANQVLEICAAGLFQMALKVGRYFVETLYEGDYKRARNPRMSKGLVSFHKVCARVHEQGGPSIRWLYDALKLAVNEYDYGSMKAYAKLSLSKKVALFRLDDNPEAKRELIRDAAEQNLTTRQIKSKAADEHWIKFTKDLDKRKPYEPTLEEKEKILTNKIERRQRKIDQLQDEIVKIQAELDIVRSQLNED